MALALQQPNSPQFSQTYALQKPQATQAGSKVENNPSPSAQNVQFGNALQALRYAPVAGPIIEGGQKLLQGFFRNIVEIYLWTFFAQDVLALWLPRIGVSLERGSIPYEGVEKDPKHKDAKGLEKRWINFRETAKGWNFANFIEECKREFATGPGLILIPSAFYAVSRRMLGLRAVEMNDQSLMNYHQSFKQFLQNNPLESVNEAAYKTRFKEFIHQQLDFDALLEGRATLGGKPLNLISDKQATRKALEGGNLSEFHNLLDNWVDAAYDAYRHQKDRNFATRLRDDVVDVGKGLTNFGKKLVLSVTDREALRAMQDGPEAMTAAKLAFREELLRFNRKHLAKDLPLSKETLPLGLLKGTFKNGEHLFESATKMTSVDEWFKDLGQFKDFAFEVFDQKTRKNLSKPLTEVADTLLSKVRANKVLNTLALVVVPGIFLWELTKWTQNHEFYVANRLIRYDDDLQAEASNKNAAKAQTATKATASERHAAEPQPVSPIEAPNFATAAITQPATFLGQQIPFNTMQANYNAYNFSPQGSPFVIPTGRMPQNPRAPHHPMVVEGPGA